MQWNKVFEHRLPGGKWLVLNELGFAEKVSAEELMAIRRQDLSGKNPLKKRLEKKHFIVNPASKEPAALAYRKRYGHLLAGVALHIVNPTLRCNQLCAYCYADAKPFHSKSRASDIDNATAKKTLDFIFQCPSKFITIEFQGGGPLANFPIIEFMVGETKKRKGKKVHFRIVSNLSLMDETIARFLQKNKIFDLCTSLDGPKRLHDANRPLSGGSSHKKVVHWMHSLKSDFGFGHIGALATITKKSLSMPEEIAGEYLGQGQHDITPVVLRRIGRCGKNWEKIGYSAEEYISFWKKLFAKCVSETREGRFISEQYTALTLKKLDNPQPSFHTCFSTPCGAALNQASYQPDGSIFACDESKSIELFRLGTIAQKYSDVFASPCALNLVSVSSTLGMLCNECSFKPLCRTCPAAAFASQGNIIPKLALDMDCRVKKAQIGHVLGEFFAGKDAAILRRWAGVQKWR